MNDKVSVLGVRVFGILSCAFIERLERIDFIY